MIDRCACPGDQLWHLDECVNAVECPAASPSPPPPSPPPSPLSPPPRQPLLSPPSSLPICTAEQEAQNLDYCYDADFGQQVCVFDGGIHCPERCGLCARAFASFDRSTTVHVLVSVDEKIHEFEPTPFRQKFADALTISAASVDIELYEGSTNVDMRIATMEGTPAAADALYQKVQKVMPDSAAAEAILAVPVLKVSYEVVTASPAPPPSQPAPPRPPPSPPPYLSEDNDTQLITILVSSVVGGLILSVIAFVVYCMPKKPKYLGMPSAPPSVIVYAESAFDHQDVSYVSL